MSRVPDSSRVLAAMSEASSYPEASGPVEMLETHISWVFLAGERAFKIKKPLDLGFLDFSTLERRRFFCEEEVRLNRRTAPELYLGVVPIADTPDGVRVGGIGPVLEYAVMMRRFAADAPADEVARRGELGASKIDEIAEVVAAFHAALPPAPPDSAYGAPDHVAAPAIQNFEQLGELVTDTGEAARLAELRQWTLSETSRLRDELAARRREGFVRECHGDLHLANIVLLDGRPTLFDGIEFNPELRWIDVMNEVAFLAMDLLEHRLDWAAWRFLSAYLEATGDYAGVRVVRYYLVYRAMVRAKIACIRARQPEAGATAQGRARHEYGEYLSLAAALATDARPAVVLMHGLSGAGKSTVAQATVERVGAVRVRSDVERKRLFGLAPGERTNAAPQCGIYSPEATRLTYERLRRVARDVVSAGYPVVVDAAFLRRAERDRFRALARERGVPFLIVACDARHETLRERLVRREAAPLDASEAGVAVLESQLATQEPLNADEIAHAVLVDANRCEARMASVVEDIASRLEHATCGEC